MVFYEYSTPSLTLPLARERGLDYKMRINK